MWLVVFFNEQDNLQIFLSQNKYIEAKQRQTPLSWCLETFQIFFAEFIKELASITIREMLGPESRSWLLWQSLSLKVAARSWSRRLQSQLHHCSCQSSKEYSTEWASLCNYKPVFTLLCKTLNLKP